MLKILANEIIDEYYSYKKQKTDSLGNIAIPTGTDRINYKKFEFDISLFSTRIEEKFNNRKYNFSDLYRRVIPKKYGGFRNTYIFTISDYIVLKLLLKSLLLHYETVLGENNYILGYRKGFSTADVMMNIRRGFFDGYEYVLHIDIVDFLNEIDRNILLKQVQNYFINVDSNEFFYLNRYFAFLDKISPFKDKGIPTGCVLNPLLSNIYLHILDLYVEKNLLSTEIRYIRYGDDLFFLLLNKIEHLKIFDDVSKFLSQELKLKIHNFDKADKTSLFDLSRDNYFVFSAYKFNKSMIQIDNHPIQWIKKNILHIVKYNFEDLNCKINFINAYILGYNKVSYKHCIDNYNYDTPLCKHSIMFFFMYSTDLQQMIQFDKWIKRTIINYYFHIHNKKLLKHDTNQLISIKKMYFRLKKQNYWEG
ncbi:MAG: hypothetical protein KKH01_08300 [Firmicutes bacterium]|nr:hypothetical protein [Bacillota bacterium]